MEFSGQMNLFEKIYLFCYLRKKEKALKNQKKLPFPVISVGNLTVGGTGKTPFTISLTNELKKKGYEPVILTRGYRGKIKKPVIVTKQHTADEVGDEPLMMALEGFRVIKSIDRYHGGLFAINEFGFNQSDKVIFIIDDGFQHWKLYKDLNIVLVDGIRGFGNGRFIPFGPLRSPIDEVIEADIVFITKRKNEELYKKLTDSGIKNIYFADLKVKCIKDGDGEEIKPSGQKVFAFAGIGNFQSFLELLTSLDLKITGYQQFIDHKQYNKCSIKKILKASKYAELLITTKKDFIKLKQSYFNKKLFYLDISMQIEHIEELLMNLHTNLDTPHDAKNLTA